VFPVADRLEAWSKRLDDMVVRLDAEQREAQRIDPHERLRLHLEANYGTDGQDGDDG
jgi:hypothetical protein